MSIEVCTVYAPRPDHSGWRDWMPLLAAQRASVIRVEHNHRVVTDVDLHPSYRQLKVVLPKSLMKAMIAGVVARLREGGNSHLVFVDIDCLVLTGLAGIFKNGGVFDLMLTFRNNPVAPINNGVMYVHALGIPKALKFFQSALDICEDHWGGDQEAISKIAAPVPMDFAIEERPEYTIKFVSMKRYNCNPKVPDSPLGGFIGHFKGSTKEWMIGYAEMFLGYKAEK